MASSGFSENKGLVGVLSLEGSWNLVSIIFIDGFSWVTSLMFAAFYKQSPLLIMLNAMYQFVSKKIGAII